MGRPKVPRIELTQEYVRSVLHYNPDTGIFTWLQDWSEAGTRKDNRGYVRIDFNSRTRPYAHRVAFLYMTGVCPQYVDHRDEDKSNNKWLNLRGATKSQNGMNRGVQKNNTSGHKGVSCQNSGFVAELWREGKKYYLGRYKSPDAAAEAVRNARIEIHGEFARCV